MMAPHNGLMNKPDNPLRRTVPVFPVVPAIPLSYTQRPVKKPTSTQPTVAPPVQNAVQETPISKITNGHHEIVNGNTARPEEVSSTADSPPSPAPVATPTAAPNSASEQSTNSSAISTPPTAVSAAHTRDASLNLGVAFSPILTPTYVHPLPATGPAPELPLHAPQSVMSNRPAFHQPHPSNGGSATGPYNHESNGNVHFGAAMQYQHAGYRPPPPQLGPLVSSGFDNWSPTRMNHPNHHGPPTPHSFHGSQASAPAEEHVYPHHPTANGQNGQSADPFQMPPPELDLAFQREQSLSFLREIGFNSTFHDCSIEIQFTPSNVEFIDHPEYAQQSFTTTISGHRVIFSRSPTLLDAMKAQSIAAGGCIRLGKIPDEYVRPDVFRYALGTFYAYDLDRPFPSSLTYRDYKDEFKTALCYIATASYLRLGWMEMAAAHRASMLLDWGTIESAVRFVALNATFSARPLEGGILLITDTVVDWLARNFPLSFDIEITADDVGFRRLPFQLPPSRTSKTPAIANGSSAEAHSRQSSQSQVQMPRDARVSSNPRLSKISFGEIASSETKPPSPSLFPNTGYSQPRQPSSIKTHILSKILLHLPYKLLKPVLEHPLLAQPQGGYLAADRLAVVTKIIAAREAMRLQAVDKTNTEFRHYHSLLESASRDMAIRTMEDFWVNTMGFKEEVFMGDIPFLVPKWTAAETRSP